MDRLTEFNPTFQIGTRTVGRGHPVLVIAEAGVAHFGDIAMARDLVDLAAESGADVFKTQLFDVEQLIASTETEWRDRLRPRNLTLDEAAELKERCDRAGLLFVATAHDPSRLSWLERLQVPAIKVGSGERNNPEFLVALAALGRPMIVSTGMYSMADVSEALAALSGAGCRDVALLHCVTSYPTPDCDVNLAAMDRLAEVFPGPVGYSDHTVDHLAVLAAVARGATVIEKHITILRDIPNAQDWKVSAGPEDRPDLVAGIRRVEALLGHGRKEPAPSESAGMAWALKSVVAATDLPARHRLQRSDLVAKRPGTGVPANRISDLVGHVLRRPVRADAQIRYEDVE
jgi:N,N'-diacetyllegionaminate synthase